jgi:hypothetical protein
LSEQDFRFDVPRCAPVATSQLKGEREEEKSACKADLPMSRTSHFAWLGSVVALKLNNVRKFDLTNR